MRFFSLHSISGQTKWKPLPTGLPLRVALRARLGRCSARRPLATLAQPNQHELVEPLDEINNRPSTLLNCSHRQRLEFHRPPGILQRLRSSRRSIGGGGARVGVEPSDAADQAPRSAPCDLSTQRTIEQTKPKRNQQPRQSTSRPRRSVRRATALTADRSAWQLIRRSLRRSPALTAAADRQPLCRVCRVP